MFLRINSSDKLLFEGKIKKVNIPTESGEIGILPGHIPLVSVVKPGIIKILPENTAVPSNLPKDMQFLFENDTLQFSISKGIVYVDGENILLVVSGTEISKDYSEDILMKMKADLEKQLQDLKVRGSIEDIEKALINLQKIEADLKLMRMKGTFNN